MALHRPEWTRTVRFRLTLTYSLLLFGLAALVVGGIYWGLSHSLDAQPVAKTFEVQKQYRGITVAQITAADVSDVERVVNYNTLRTLRLYSAGTLGGLFAGSLVIGWWLSGRALRPVSRITATAREISATDLSRRIRLSGPDDELRRLADTVDGMLARLDDAFAAQRRLVDDASHELRNPLAIIQTNVDAVLARDDVTPAERRHAATVVGRAAARMSRLVEDLLASARRDAPAFQEADVELAEVVGEASEEFRLLAGERHLTLRRRVEPGTVVSGDRDALRRALANLVGNAVELAPEFTEVLVAAGREGGWCWMAVRDAGPGIGPGEQARVFDRFWQGQRGRRPGHAGLGLAIVRQIAESHGGAVALHSTPGVGSTFVVWLPSRARTGGEDELSPPAGDPLPRLSH
ncbi:MAG TPA: HAMP domain-containing sensor histidine kinase [Mycobacteriales bacterium]